jgi:glycine/D-amino acid oxidase-like deaminating enzyme
VVRALSMRNYDVIIVGSGITGLSCALRLCELSPKIKMLVVERDAGGVSARGCGYVIGGTWDNFSRAVVAHGQTTATDLWRFGARGRDLCEAMLRRLQIPTLKGEIWRHLATEHEAEEARSAVKELQAVGFAASIQKKDCGRGLAQVQIVAEESPIWFDGAGFVQKLRQSVAEKSVPFRRAKVTQLGSEAAVLANGETLTAHVLVAASHTDIGQMVPNLSTVAVPFVDQFAVCSAAGSVVPAGTLLLLQHGHFFAGKLANDLWTIGGGRYLRTQEGVGTIASDYSEPALRATTAYLEKHLGLRVVADKSKVVLADCRPCDELPVIGPMHGDSSVLVATGYMQSGFAFGIAAGRAVAELIVSGKCPELPRIFWPERLRSLPE